VEAHKRTVSVDAVTWAVLLQDERIEPELTGTSESPRRRRTMDTTRFDQFTFALASSRTRRQALRSFAGFASAAVVATALGVELGEARRKGGGKGKGKGKGGKGGGNHGGNSGGGGHDGATPPPVTRPRDMCPVSAKVNAPICGSEPGGLTCDCHRATEGNNFCGGQVDTCASLRPCTSTQDCRESVGFHFFCQAADGGACGQVCVPECANTNPF
jgi:hypothetical protein